ncbi:MAG: inosamine-phosphate amidinotransferase 1 [Polyangiales bacterium]
MTACPVSSHNEWDPLEEVIVGRLEHAAVPPWHLVERARGLTGVAALALRALAGRRYPWVLRANAQRELEGFVRLLEREGVTVRRPDVMDHTRTARTPFWSSSGFCTASPRDLLLVVGDEVIEAPSPWRARYFEGYAYRSLLKDYFARGARWSAAPKPQLSDALYDPRYRPPRAGEAPRSVINEWEPVFDAADFARCGRDLFVTLGNATNRAGVEWLRRHLGEGYAVHEIPSRCPTPMHIDTTFIPLRPGFAMINPEFVDRARLPEALRGWELVDGPPPDPIPGLSGAYLSLVSAWIHLNVLSLDPRRVVVERSQVTLHNALRRWGFDPIPCDFMHYRVFGGGFHCATVDVRRRGELARYA